MGCYHTALVGKKDVCLIEPRYSVAYTSEKKEVAADRRAAQRSGSARDVVARKSTMLNSSRKFKEVAGSLSQGAGQRSSPSKAVAAYYRNLAGQKTQSARLSSTKKFGNYRWDGAAQRSVSAKDVAARNSAMLSNSMKFKEVAGSLIQGAGQRSSPSKAVAAYYRNLAEQKTQSARLSSTKKFGNYRWDGAAQRSVSAKDVAARNSAILSSSSATEVAGSRVQGASQRSSPSKAVAAYHRNLAGQKTQSALLSSTKKFGNYRRDGAAQRSVFAKNVRFKQKVTLGSKQGRDYRDPVTNVSKKPSLSITTGKTQRHSLTRTLNSKATKKMLRRVMFTTTDRYGLRLQSGPNSQKPQQRFIMPTRMGRSGNLEIVTPTSTTMPPFDPLNPKRRRKSRFVPNPWDIVYQCLNVMTQIVYATQGQHLDRVEKIAERYKHDTRYRMAFILLKLDHICDHMTRRQTFIETKLVKNQYGERHYQWYYQVTRMIAFYTDLLRQNIDVTYGVEYVFILYREKAIERESAREAKKERKKMKEALAKNKN